MTVTRNAFAPAIEETEHERVKLPGNPVVAGGETLSNALPPQAPRWATPLPTSSFSVMLVADGHGYFQPLCTASDLLRWCKAVWRADLF